MPDGLNTEPIERWMAKRRTALILSVLKGETSVVNEHLEFTRDDTA